MGGKTRNEDILPSHNGRESGQRADLPGWASGRISRRPESGRRMDHRAYYENGRVARSEYDNNFDGKPDEWWTFSDNGTDTMQRDTDFNGVLDEFCTYKYRIIQTVDFKPNGSIPGLLGGMILFFLAVRVLPLMKGVPPRGLFTVTVSFACKTASYATGAAIRFNSGA